MRAQSRGQGWLDQPEHLLASTAGFPAYLVREAHGSVFPNFQRLASHISLFFSRQMYLQFHLPPSNLCR